MTAKMNITCAMTCGASYYYFTKARFAGRYFAEQMNVSNRKNVLR